jgi:hypothetical protein
MWTRATIKSNAKTFLRKHYWKAFAMSLVLFLVGGNDNLMFSGGNNSRPTSQEGISVRVSSFDLSEILRGGSSIRLDVGDALLGGSSNLSGWFIERIGIPTILIMSVFLALTVMFLFIGFRIFVGAPLEVGGRKFFLRGIRDDVDMMHLAAVFKSPHYLNVVKTMLLRAIYNFFWYLLLIIPGIVKHYAYRLVPYILSEEPDLDAAEAIGRSMKMTEGHKLDMFMLDLSFIGWYLLGALLLGIGVIFVNPYYEATYAQLYAALSQNLDEPSATHAI